MIFPPVRKADATVMVYAIVDVRSSPDHPLGEAVDMFVRRLDAERFLSARAGELGAPAYFRPKNERSLSMMPF